MLRYVLDGLSNGGVLGLSTIGFSFFWRVSGVINLAQGSFVLLGAFITWWLSDIRGFPLALAAALAVCVAWLFGYVLQTRMIRMLAPVPEYLGLLLTFGVGLGISSLLTLAFSSDYRSVASTFGSAVISDGSLNFSLIGIVGILASIGLILAGGLLSRRTRLGLVLSAVADDRRVAQMAGLPVWSALGLAAGVSTALAASSGVLIAVSGTFSTSELDQFTLFVSVAAVLGGLGSKWGAFWASLVLGAVQSIVLQYLPSELADTSAFLFLLAAISLHSNNPLSRFGPFQISGKSRAS